jgi:site-specific DNA-cytosine methylase
MTDESTVWEYDGYNQKIDDSGVHRTLRIGRDSSDFIAYQDVHLFEPMSMREENWAESGVKNALRAGASKSSHAIVSPDNLLEGVWSVSFRGREGGMTAEQGEEGVANTIRAGQGGSVRPHILISDRPVGTLTTDMGTKMQINNQSVDSNHLQVFSGGQEMTGQETNLVVRRLTPLECELLMGWDEGWTSAGIQEDGTEVKMADTHRYRMCGNGVVANVAEWFGLRYVQAKNATKELSW